MQFLSSEQDFDINKDSVLCFYSSDLCYPIASMLFANVAKLTGNINTLCIDIKYFDGLGKRFAIAETPTTLLIKNAREKERFIGSLDQKNIDLILTMIQTNENYQ
jgi:hypothetical protein